MSSNYANYRGLNTNELSNLESFSDEQMISDYAYSAVAWCVNVKLMNGSKHNNELLLKPNAKATRAECAKMFSLLYNQIENSKNY